MAGAERADRTGGKPAVDAELPSLAIARIDAEHAGPECEAGGPRELVAETDAADARVRPRVMIGPQLVADARLRDGDEERVFGEQARGDRRRPVTREARPIAGRKADVAERGEAEATVLVA